MTLTHLNGGPMELTTHFDFDYVVTALTTSGETINDEGHVSTSTDLAYGEGGVFNEAVQSSMDHFYTFQVEKRGRQIVEATVTVRNFQFK